jgi:EmrB/QacA subfamily drug resistance transporter
MFRRLSLPRRALIPLIVACALFMESLDSTIVATALPAIAATFGEHPLDLNLAITAYLLSLAVFIPLSGWMADRYGARTIFVAAMAVFSLGSAACGSADSLLELVAARVVQGIGGAMMVPVGRLAIVRALPKAELVSAMAFLTVPGLIGPVIGPPLGGFIVTFSSWRWIFYINVPVALLGIVLAARFIDNTREANQPKLDLRGFVLVAVALVGLMFGFMTAGRGLLPISVAVALLAIGALSAVIYFLHARNTPHRIVDFSLLRLPTFRAALGGGFLLRSNAGAVPFLLPLLFQLGFGLSAFTSGLITFMTAVGAMAMKITAPPIIRSFGYRRVLIVNGVISSLFVFTYAMFTPATPYLLILGILLAGGFFRSLQFTSVNTIAYAEVAHTQTSQATTILAVERQLSQSLGIGIGALLLHLTVVWRGGDETLTAADFAPAFVGIGVLALLQVLFFLPLSPQAGDEVRGRRSTAPLADRTEPLS